MGQLIISIGREFGSGGHSIANILSEKLGLPVYDYNLLQEIAAKKSMNAVEIKKYDEMPKNIWLSRTVRGYNNSPEQNTAHIQFEYIQEMALEGKSFIILGRCAETVLAGCPSLISIFVLADMEDKIKRTAEKNNIPFTEAESLVRENNKKRKNYHNFYCQGKWGDSRNYDISINSSRLGIEKTADLLEIFIKQRAELFEK